MKKPKQKVICGFVIDCWPMEGVLDAAIALDDQAISAKDARRISASLIKAAEWRENEAVLALLGKSRGKK